jgi:cell cycle checkpoint protein
MSGNCLQTLGSCQAELAPGKARIAKVRNWLHMSLYGCPMDQDPDQSSLSPRVRDNVRKYKVGL